MTMDPKKYVVGIDLGTRNSCASVWINGHAEIVCDSAGNRTIPSIVSFFKSVKLVGHNALPFKEIEPHNTIYDIKRIIGRRFYDPSIEKIKSMLPYNIICDNTTNQNILIETIQKNSDRKQVYCPEEICSFILKEIKNNASNYFKTDITDAIITVPAFFNDSQRQATLDSAKIAGFNVLKIINEPTAAALAYGLGKRNWMNSSGGNVIVYDFGAGTLDVSLMNIFNGTFKTLAVSGNMHLGGEDIDNLVINHILRNANISLAECDKANMIKLKYVVENAKKILTTADKTSICVENFINGKQLLCVLTRNELEKICNELFILCIKPIDDVLASSRLSRNEIDEVILVGGSSRIPKIQELILQYFKNTNIKNLITSINPDEIVSSGASAYGYIMTNNDDPFLENIMLLDVTPLSLGVETLQKKMAVIIPRNTTFPITKTKIFSTDTDYQSSVNVKIFEGERKLTKHNFFVGNFNLSGFDKAPRGYPLIKITFQIDTNGILKVSACEKRSGVQNEICVNAIGNAKGRLSDDDINNIIREAEENNNIDTLLATKIELIHKLHTMCKAININLKDPDSPYSVKQKNTINNKIKKIMSEYDYEKVTDIELDDLKAKVEFVSSKYVHLVTTANTQNNMFESSNAGCNASEIHGDGVVLNNNNYDQFVSFNGDLDEIKSIKQNISDLCNNIINVSKNPISNLSDDDINMLCDYMESVQVWLYTTSSCNGSDYVMKINEINALTNSVLSKYGEKEIFNRNNMSSKDELEILCLSLKSSFESKFFYSNNDNIEPLKNLVDDTVCWLLKHQSEPDSVYSDRIDSINNACNEFHNDMSLGSNEKIESSTESDSNDDASLKKNDIIENIDDIIKSIDHSSVYLRIDINKLNNNHILRYKDET